MGHSSKKKRGGRKSKGRALSKDHASHADENNDALCEELTALHAIFQEDCKIVSDSPPQLIIKLRPYSKNTGSEDLDVSALLLVRCFPGYPYKCPKLQVTPEKGVSKDNVDKLLSLLYDEANLNAREGRVMIFNLVEAAQEFLSEIASMSQSDEVVPCPSMHVGDKLLQGDATSASEKTCSPGGTFVYGLIDLFSGCGELWHWGLEMDKIRVESSSKKVQMLDSQNLRYKGQESKIFETFKPAVLQDTDLDPRPATKLDYVGDESEDDTRIMSSTSGGSLVEELFGNDVMNEEEDLILEEKISKVDASGLGGEPFDAMFSTSVIHDKPSQAIKRDLLMVHLLRVACADKGPLSGALPEITSELYNLQIFSQWMRDLAIKPSLIFNKALDHAFRDHMVSSRISQFWTPTSGFGKQNTSSLPSSHYLNDFEELSSLGHGGFGHVVLCKNKLDGRQYAVKKIRIKDKNVPCNDRILREVATLSRLQHQHVVRYYQAWYETGVVGSYEDATLGLKTEESSIYSYMAANSANAYGPDNNLESTYLFIQMEYCPRTLHQIFESYTRTFEKDNAWHLFHQIVEGLAHIHGQGIIHRDLTPNNIFFDARNDIKIGDFGLAKFLKLEQLDHDSVFPMDTTGVSVDGTGQVGTYFYTAPEIEQGWPKIDEKVDMYSLGIVFFELWHPFGTAMERNVVLSDLKQKGELPPAWVAEFPEQALLLRRLMSSSPSDRPSANELLKEAFPPQMEDEWLDDTLQKMQMSEDTHVYEKVVNAIFDEDRLFTKMNRQQSGVKLARDVSSFIQCTDTERRDYVVEVTKDVFRQHCAKRLEISSMRLLEDYQQLNRSSVKLLSQGGDMIELCRELRLPFVNWVILNQVSSFKRYEISSVYRRAIGHSTPNRYLQGDFDIIGGASALTEAEVIKATMDIITQFFHLDSCDIRLNHGGLLEVIWSWIGIEPKLRQSVAERLSLMGSFRPQSSERKSKWVFIRRQLLQDLNLSEVVVNRLQTVGLRFCGIVDQALPRLRGALPTDKLTRKALEELSALFSYLRVWRIDKHVFIDCLMPPMESFHRDLFFQIYLSKENNAGLHTEGALLAAGGRYDHMLHQMWDHEYKSNPPGAVGTSLALETILQHPSVDHRMSRNEACVNVLICSRGGGGLLEERMELVAELWQEGIKADFVPMADPSLTEQYEYANEHDIKCLVIITDTQAETVKVRHLELKKEKKVTKSDLVKFLMDAIAIQFRNPYIWT